MSVRQNTTRFFDQWLEIYTYVAWLEASAAQNGGKIDPAAQEALRRGWYLGEDSFRDRLLALVEKAKGITPRKRRKPQVWRKIMVKGMPSR